MKKLILFSLFAFAAVFTACDKEEDMHTEEEHEHEATDFAYHAHILSPDAEVKNLNDTIHVHINFESHTGETVHNIDVRFYKEGDLENAIYVAADNEHVHEEGEYDYHADIVLDPDHGFSRHGDYVLKATVYGHEAGEGEESEELKFHVHQ